MRVSALIAGLVLAVAMTTAAAAQGPAKGGQCKTICSPAAEGGLCKVICAPPPALVAQAKPKPKPAPAVKRVAVKPPVVKQARAKRVVVRPAPVRRAARHRPHHYARSHDYYGYREAEVARDEGYDSWHQAPNDAVIPGPQPYGPPPPPPPPSGYYAEAYAQDYQRNGVPCDCAPGEAGLEIDRHGWTGGVGYAGGAEVFVDGYGMVHYGSSRSLNGPTYNSYSQSFQFNPSRAAPFQPRAMGGFGRR